MAVGSAWRWPHTIIESYPKSRGHQRVPPRSGNKWVQMAESRGVRGGDDGEEMRCEDDDLEHAVSIMLDES